MGLLFGRKRRSRKNNSITSNIPLMRFLGPGISGTGIISVILMFATGKINMSTFDVLRGGASHVREEANQPKIQPVSIHGQISWDVYYTDADDPEGQVATARVGPESMNRDLEPGDRIRLHFVLGVVTDVTRADEPA